MLSGGSNDAPRGVGRAGSEERAWRAQTPRRRYRRRSELAQLPARLRPFAEWVLQHWLGRFLLGCMVTTRKIELFDRSMTLAAQIFTSVLPILIALASWVRPRQPATSSKRRFQSRPRPRACSRT